MNGAAYRTVEAIYARLMREGSGEPFSATDACSADGESLFFIGAVCDAVTEPPRAVVYRAAPGGGLDVLHPGPSRLLELSPDGALIAFATPGAEPGLDRLMIIDTGGMVVGAFATEGRVEQICWSPDCTRLLVLVAGSGTDTTTLAGSLGGASPGADGWEPQVEDGTADPEDWRRLSIHRIGAPLSEQVPAIPGMIWEASWCGDAALAVLVSDRAGEAAWYRASLALVDLATGRLRTLHAPADQIGQVRGSPEGDRIAFVEGVASDRGLVCGLLKIVRPDGGEAEILPTGTTEITSVAWRGAALHIAGQRGLVTMIGDHDLSPGGFRERWSSEAWSCGAHVPTSRPFGTDGAIAVMEGQSARPRLAVVGERDFATVHVFGEDGDAASNCTPVRWTAPDGLEIEGLLVRPVDARGRLPLVVDIHGGPVWAYRARWEGRQRAVPALAAAGFAVLCPNPRGSFARGQDFARHVHGDMGGADVGDILSGIDHLVLRGIVDPARVGLTGSSYGGYMSAWLPKLRSRFAAAVCISPVSNWFSQHFTSNMPVLEEIFIGGVPGRAGGDYLARSPALSPTRTEAATLILAGALDRCTPIGQSVELHRSLLEQGSASVLVTYPREGHGVRSPRGYIDSAARTLDWFTRHMAP